VEADDLDGVGNDRVWPIAERRVPYERFEIAAIPDRKTAVSAADQISPFPRDGANIRI
jgi:hypothetical protein